MIPLFTSSTLECGLVGGLDVETGLFKAINIMGSSPLVSSLYSLPMFPLVH